MATFDTELYKAQNSHGQWPQARFANAKVRYAICEYKTAGSEAAGDTVNLCRLPAGVLPVPALSHIMHRHAAEIKVSIGVASDPVLYGEQIRLHGSNTNVSIGQGSPPAYTGLGDQFYKPKVLGEGDEVVSLKFDTAVANARDITVYLAYIAE